MTSNVLGLVVGVPIGQRPLDTTQQPSRAARRKAALTAPSESLRYIYPPPLAQRDHADESKLPKPPHPNAPSYQRSVYYYWWAYLREYDEYLACCRAGGIGAHQELFGSFGDVRHEDFWGWWCGGAYRLFCENDGMVELAAPHHDGAQTASDVVLKIPLALDVDTALAQVRVLLQHRRALSPPVPRSSTALFPVVGTPVLSALHKTLTVLRAKRAHPQLANYEVFDLAGLSGYGPAGSKSRGDRDDKTMEVSRRLAEARRLMAAAAAGRFPGRTSDTKQRRAEAAAAIIAMGSAEAQPKRRRQVLADQPPAAISAYVEPPDVDTTIELVRPCPQRKWLQVEGNRLATRLFWRLSVNSQDSMEAVDRWTQRHRDSLPDWHLPLLDEWVSPANTRVLILLPLHMCDLDVSSSTKVASLLNSNPSAAALYRMAIYQNRLPLHWCLPCSMFLHRDTRDEKKGALEQQVLDQGQLADLIDLLPNLQAVVLVGSGVQEAWAAAKPNVGTHVRVWRCEEPSDALKAERPDLWLTIPSRLPTRDDVAG